MDPDQKVGVSLALPGMEVYPLEADFSPKYAYILIKSTDAEDIEQWSIRSTGYLNREELLGVLTVQIERLKAELISVWD